MIAWRLHIYFCRHEWGSFVMKRQSYMLNERFILFQSCERCGRYCYGAHDLSQLEKVTAPSVENLIANAWRWATAALEHSKPIWTLTFFRWLYHWPRGSR